MAEEQGVDLLMKFKQLDGNYVSAESTDSVGEGGSGGSSFLSRFFFLETAAGKQDPLLKGFRIGNVFEVFNFSFGTGMDWDPKQGEGHPMAAILAGLKMLPDTPENRGFNAYISQMKRPAPRRNLIKWKCGDKGSVQLQPVTFSRSLDQASSTLLQRCFNSEYFEKVTLVKRRATGGQASGYGYLRMDFGGVMITQINWSNDDEVKESVTFVCRSVQIQYKPMLPSGKLGGTVGGEWKMESVRFPPPDA